MKSKKLHHKSELNCAYCDKEFKYESERKRHEQSHSPQFQCKVCNKKFSFLSAVRRHEKQHERTGTVVCDECNRKFRDESLLKRHMKYAHKGSFSCAKCGSTFRSELALRAHTKTHRPEAERRFRCSHPGCGKTFNFTHHLKHHELTHTNTKQHYCNICGKGFIQSHHLKSHKKRHEKNDMLLCEISGCKKSFSTEYALMKHLATHKTSDKTSDVEDSSASERKSSCDVSELMESDAASFVARDQELSEDGNIKIVTEFVVTKETIEINNEETQTRLLSKPEPVKIELNDDISTCKSYVGGCIMEADANGNNCVCVQISGNNTDIYELTPNENALNAKKNTVQISSEIDIKDSVCEGCACAGNKTSNGICFENSGVEDVPKIEYRNDGTIKIKDTFDIDIPACTSAKVENYFDIPYNSCKAVLGKCIVSGNGTIDEGCLCARMAMDDQQMISQEIEELTPCPK